MIYLDKKLYFPPMICIMRDRDIMGNLIHYYARKYLKPDKIKLLVNELAIVKILNTEMVVEI